MLYPPIVTYLVARTPCDRGNALLDVTSGLINHSFEAGAAVFGRHFVCVCESWCFRRSSCEFSRSDS